MRIESCCRREAAGSRQLARNDYSYGWVTNRSQLVAAAIVYDARNYSDGSLYRLELKCTEREKDRERGGRDRENGHTVTRSSRSMSLMASICISTLVVNVAVNWCFAFGLLPRQSPAVRDVLRTRLPHLAAVPKCAIYKLRCAWQHVCCIITRLRSRSSANSLTSHNRCSLLAPAQEAHQLQSGARHWSYKLQSADHLAW